MLKKAIKVGLLTILFYLIHVCVLPLLPIGGICANGLIAGIAIMEVACGKHIGFIVACVMGVLMEAMSPSLSYLYLALYPILGVLGGTFFADKSERDLERRRTLQRKRKQLPGGLRTVLCAALMTTVSELIFVAYEWLNDVPPTFWRTSRVIMTVIYTVAVTVVLMIAARKILGIRKLPKRRLHASDYIR